MVTLISGLQELLMFASTSKRDCPACARRDGFAALIWDGDAAVSRWSTSVFRTGHFAIAAGMLFCDGSTS